MKSLGILLPALALVALTSQFLKAGGGHCDCCGCCCETHKKKVAVVEWKQIETPCFQCTNVDAYHPCKGFVCHRTDHPFTDRTPQYYKGTRDFVYTPVHHDCCGHTHVGHEVHCQICEKKQCLCECEKRVCGCALGVTGDGCFNSVCAERPSAPGCGALVPVVKWITVEACDSCCDSGAYKHHHGHGHGHGNGGHAKFVPQPPLQQRTPITTVAHDEVMYIPR